MVPHAQNPVKAARLKPRKPEEFGDQYGTDDDDDDEDIVGLGNESDANGEISDDITEEINDEINQCRDRIKQNKKAVRSMEADKDLPPKVKEEAVLHTKELIKKTWAQLRDAKKRLAEHIQKVKRQKKEAQKKRKVTEPSSAPVPAADKADESRQKIYEFVHGPEGLDRLDAKVICSLLVDAKFEVAKFAERSKARPDDKKLLRSLHSARAAFLNIEFHAANRKDVQELLNRNAGRSPEENTEGEKKPPARQTQRENPDHGLLTSFKGKFVGVPEWVRVLIRAAIKHKKLKAEAKTEETAIENKESVSKKHAKEVATGNLILVLAQLAYWSESDQNGNPRMSEEWCVNIDGAWWLTLRPSALAKQVGLERHAVLAAINRLRKMNILEIWMGGSQAKRHHGPKTQYVRLVWEDIQPCLTSNMKPRARRSPSTKSDE